MCTVYCYYRKIGNLTYPKLPKAIPAEIWLGDELSKITVKMA